ncbi:ATP-binding protein [Bacillus sp. 31A1R]|uniref:histidine kinase n=1 Tax=Robertmurraya mangrovi TaxID=3098077 RepID=A0ABU5J2Q0_9BACI|nr:ATP-binding protein [Bacillus sp. 31A1R]MDZ5473679.1 ATP-binding protein [Bacillus sp. 31A1R]
MLDTLKDLVLNLFFIFICFSVLIAFEYRKNKLKQLNQIPLVILASIAVVLCITFPIQLDKHFMFDLRLVPIVVAGLYGGWPVVIMLLLVNIGYRSIWGGYGVYVTIIVASIHALLICVVSPIYQRLSLKKRIFSSILMGFFSSLSILIVNDVFFNNPLPINLSIIILILQTSGIFFFVWFFELINHLRRLQERMIRTEKMEIVSHLASSFTHEVRNPMTTVRGFLQLISGMDMEKEKLTNYISIAISEIDRAESIITEYLSFTKPTSGELHILEGEEVLHYSVEVIRPLANANCVDLYYKPSSFYLKGNKQRLQQAFINLFKNAIEAMPSGGSLSISVELKQKLVMITIADTGIGMTEEQLNHLGEPYFSSKGENGTGLGMTVVYNIVESVGGTIKVKSQIGQGTQFILTFPQRHINEFNQQNEEVV